MSDTAATFCHDDCLSRLQYFHIAQKIPKYIRCSLELNAVNRKRDGFLEYPCAWHRFYSKFCQSPRELAEHLTSAALILSRPAIILGLSLGPTVYIPIDAEYVSDFGDEDVPLSRYAATVPMDSDVPDDEQVVQTSDTVFQTSDTVFQTSDTAVDETEQETATSVNLL